MTNLLQRAANYYRKHGFKRSMWMLKRKLTGTAPPRLPSPHPYPAAGDGGYFGYFERALAGPRIDLHPKAASRLFRFGNVAVIGDLNLPQCRKYRVLQKLEAVNALGLGSNYSHWQDVPRSLNLMQTASTAIIYRVQANDAFWAYLKEAVRLGISVGYDIDDPIFDHGVYSQNKNLDFLDPAEKRQLLSGSDSYLKAMRACDFLVTSTPGMIALAERYYKGPTYLWRNAVDFETLHAAENALAVPRTGLAGIVTIGYASGSRAHEADFRAAESALAATLEKHPNVRLLVIGYLKLPELLEPFADRIDTQPFETYEGYLSTLAGVDLNVVPLLDDAFNDCKSAIRYLDASVVAVPTIASAVGDFVNVVSDESIGLLARNAGEWESHLDRLIEQEALRKSIGAAARRAALERSTTTALALGLDPRLQSILKPKLDVAA